MAKNNKIEEKQEQLYTITVTEKQLALINEACDNAGRIYRGIPNTANIFDNVLVERHKEMDASFWQKRKLIGTTLQLLTEIINPENRTDRTETEHIYHDMHQVIRNFFHNKYYEDRDEEPTSFSVSSSIHKTSSDRLIKVQKIENNITTEKLSEQNKLNILESLLMIVQQDHKEFEEENTTGWDLIKNAKIWIDELKKNKKIN